MKTVTADDREQAVDTIVLAFASDPVCRWCWPDPHQYLTSTPSFFQAFGGGAFANDGAHCTDDFTGVALWLAPGVHPDEAGLGEIITRTVAPSLHGDLFAVLEQMATYHPSEPHWYLPIIGVDPACQGKGYGSRLMAYALERFDREHLPAYLESSNPKNIPFYRRHGFELLGQIQVGTSPIVTPMLRRAR